MNILFENAKNASLTCSVDGRFLHSKYNPENEAKNFVSSVECDFQPSCIIITGACLPYCMPLFQERFANTPVLAIQYNQAFFKYDIEKSKKWDSSFYCSDSTISEVLCEEIFSKIGEMALSSPLILSWKSADDYFVTECLIAWKALQLLMIKTRDVLATRAYFSYRWLKNSVKFCTHVNLIALVKTQEVPVLLVASGPSLKESLPYIKKFHNNFFIIVVSSALCTLVEHGIIPDMCVSTDGGYYAKKHLHMLEKLRKKGISIPLAVSSESSVPSDILEHCLIVPLRYDDGMDTEFLDICNIKSMKAERNGTVSGTAAMLALSLTKKDVYACGLDLTNGNGYSHTLPNTHESINSLSDFRFSPISHRLFMNSASQNTGQTPLDLYRQWFETRSEYFSHRFFRLSADSFKYENTLGTIKDITWSSIESRVKQEKKASTVINTNIILSSERKIRLKQFIYEGSCNTSESWKEALALGELLSAKKYPSSPEHVQKCNEKVQNGFKTLEDMCI